MALEARKYKQRAKRLGELLVQDGLITEDQLKIALDRQKQRGQFLGECVVALGYLRPLDLGNYLEETMGFPFVDISEAAIDPEYATKLSESYCRQKGVLPYASRNGKALVAMADPLNVSLADDLRARLNQPIEPHLAFSTDISDAIRRTFTVQHKTRSVLQEISEPTAKQEIELEDLLGMAEDAPIVRLVNSILQGALINNASDVHIEPQEDLVRVRYRIDGLLYEQMTLPQHNLAAVVSRLKIMSSLDIAERRRPQDGRFTIEDESKMEFEARLSIMPTVYGEKAVMRLLQKSGTLGALDSLGFFPEQLAAYRRFIKRPHGIILVTGPTGSGKSTSLYAALQEVNDSTLNINTIEDPVEYRLGGVNQVQVNPRIGVTFANGLRTLVRQDPDVILVGEIRDAETAEIAIQAALTGHLVLSTLHTNDAPGALVRLQNMGVEPFLISSAVVGVVGQRLLRTLCPHCKKTEEISTEFARSFGVDTDKPVKIARGKGCPRCGNRGTRGRTAVYELMPMSDLLREAVLKRNSSAEIFDIAMREGMKTMRQSGAQKVLDLQVSPEEALRVLATEE